MLLDIYRIVSLTSRSPWMTFWASLSVGISEPPASQVQQHSQAQVDVSWKGQLERHRSAPGRESFGRGAGRKPSS